MAKQTLKPLSRTTTNPNIPTQQIGSTNNVSADQKVEKAAALIQKLQNSVQQAAVVSSESLTLILTTLLAQGHLLLEDVPGIGKTLVAKALAGSVSASFKRIQCTPDLLPSDITGTSIYNQQEQTFKFMPGPIFAQFVLVDEINRATPRTQSSLLESMAEGQVTVDGQQHTLQAPFFLIATQNPVEMSGTYPLPEAQLDRFLISLDLGYPGFEDEVLILEREEHGSPLSQIRPVLSPESIVGLQKFVQTVSVVRSLKEYMVKIASATRSHPDVLLGISPRGAVALQRAAQAIAVINQRHFVIPDDIKAVAKGVLAHRLITHEHSPELARSVLDSVLRSVPVPVK